MKKISTPTRKADYSVQDAMADYLLEAGSKRSSAEALKARLKLMNGFFEEEIDGGRLPEAVMPINLDQALLDRVRDWAVNADQIATRKRGPNREWTYSYQPRSPATVEESIIALKAALNHCTKRLSSVPKLKHKTREEVTSERLYRLSTEMFAQILGFTAEGAGTYAGHADRLLPLRRYLIAAISTLARPDAVFDMSVTPARQQWHRDHQIFALNPDAAAKRRKCVRWIPVTSVLAEWLQAIQDWVIRQERDVTAEDGQLSTIQQRVAAVDSAWSTVTSTFGIPPGWAPKLIRHPVATILTNRRVDPLELEIVLGHRPVKRTTGKYATFHPDYLKSIRD